MPAGPKPRAVFYHYSKPASQAAGKPIISVHQSGKCHLVEELEVQVPMKSRTRNKQPRFVMTGSGILRLEGNKAIIHS